MATFRSACGSMFISNIDGVSHPKAKGLRHRVTSSYGEKLSTRLAQDFLYQTISLRAYNGAANCERSSFRVLLSFV